MTKKKEIFELVDLEVEEVSLVDNPANPDATVMFYKSASEEEEKAEEDEEEEPSQDAPGEPSEPSSDESEGEMDPDSASEPDLSDPAEEDEDEEEKAEKSEKVDQLLELQKAHQIELNKVMNDLNEALEKVKKYEEEIETKKYLDEASSYDLPGLTQEEMADLIKSCPQKDSLRTLLKACSEALGKSSLFDEVGVSVNKSVSNTEKADAMAQELVNSGKFHKKYDALAHIYTAHPELRKSN